MHFHNTLKCALLAGLLGGLGALNSHGQYTFSSGSDGSYGAMNITTNTTLDLPPDGKFNCTTITVASNAILKFNPNALNTPVYLLATADVVVNGTIDVSGSAGVGSLGGAGGPGGFAGGNAMYGGLPAGDGHGPGGGRAQGGQAGAGAYGSRGGSLNAAGLQGQVYGSPLLVPLLGGSGASGLGNPGTGGGGAILLASSTRVSIHGTILATGPTFNYGNYSDLMGSGGAIRLAAPIVVGRGTLNVLGGLNNWSGYRGGAGRIRLDCMDRRSLALNLSGTSSIGANMVVFPTNAPHLDITQVAGNSIPVGTGSAVSFTLPQDSPTNQTVTVQASNFGAPVPIRVVLTPDNGPSSSYDADIDNTVNPASVTLPVVVPVNVQVHVNAWTR